jgi:hypothetical protein
MIVASNRSLPAWKKPIFWDDNLFEIIGPKSLAEISELALNKSIYNQFQKLNQSLTMIPDYDDLGEKFYYQPQGNEKISVLNI